MAEVNGLIAKIIGFHEEFIDILAGMGLEYVGTFINIMLLILVAFLYVLFVWKLYRFIATRDFLGQLLNKYNQSESAFIIKLVYFLQYIIISPFLIFIWFGVFTLFLTLLTESVGVEELLIIATIIVSVIRMTSYYNEELARDIAKMLPFTLLAIAITNPNFLKIERMLTQLGGIPELFSNVIIYLLFIFILEATLRFFGFIFSLFGLEEVENIN